MRKFLVDWKNADLDWRSAFIVVAIASVASLFLGLLGFPVVGHDAIVHLNWMDQFVKLREQGVTYPRWLPMSFGGFGAATFYFYPPLPYWFASFFHSLFPISPSGLYNALAMVASIASVCTTWWLLRQYSSNRIAALTGALAYSFIGYRLVDVFIRDALGEHWALVFLPLVFLRFEDRTQRIILIAIAWCGLFLTNIPTAFIAAMTVGVMIALEVPRQSRMELFDYAISTMLALMMSAVYIMPALALHDRIQSQHLWDTHFLSTGFAILDLLQGQRGGLKTQALATLAAGIVCVGAAWHNKHDAPRTAYRCRAWLWIAIAAIIIQVPISGPLWHDVIPFKFIQFSWRWNGILLLAIVIMTVKSKSAVMPLALIALASVTLFGEASLSQEFALHPKLPFDRYRIDAPEYAPKWTPSDANVVRVLAYKYIDDPPAVLLGLTFPSDSVKLLSRTSKEWTFNAQLSRETPVRFRQFYWPYWQAFRGSDTITLQPDALGFATALLPAGSYELRLVLIRSPYEKAGIIVSYIGAALLIVLLGGASYKKLRKL